jgi:hypothetical protein
VLGQSLAAAYREVLDQPLPEALARMVRQIEQRAPRPPGRAG